jgi:hypothetical protein
LHAPSLTPAPHRNGKEGEGVGRINRSRVLTKRSNSAPRTVKTFSSTLYSLFQQQLPEDEIAPIVAEFRTRGWAAVTDSKVAFSLPLPRVSRSTCAAGLVP